jgi:hypothetical protein
MKSLAPTLELGAATVFNSDVFAEAGALPADIPPSNAATDKAKGPRKTRFFIVDLQT